MLNNPDYIIARDLLLRLAVPVGTERVSLDQCGGRILAADLAAEAPVPPFDRSAYDGYAFRSADVESASRECPVTLRILEEIPAGAVPTVTVETGTAVKLLTGAPVPPGADVVLKYERTRFDDASVTVFESLKPGSNIVKRGEDVQQGQVLACAGTVIDAGLAGTLAAQGVAMPMAYRQPVIGLISTGNEVVEADADLAPGKIRNSNRTTLVAVLEGLGCQPQYLGLAGDDVARIRERIEEGLERCDAVLLTGGVSVGDYDLTPDAMEQAGVEVLVRGVNMKPGMACAYGVKDGKLVLGLSGNPASSLTNFYAVVLPAIRTLCGRSDAIPAEITVTLASGFRKKSPLTRFLRGTLDLSDGTVRMTLPKEQGNVVLSSTIGCNVMAVVPAGSGPVEAGTSLKGFLL